MDSIWEPQFGDSVSDQCRIFQGESLDPLRVSARLQSAYVEGRLVLTLPWLVEYIAMLRGDAVTLHAPYYQALLEQLAQISVAVQTAKIYDAHARLRLLVSELVTGLFDSLQLPYPTYSAAHRSVWLTTGLQGLDGCFDSRTIRLADPPSLPATAIDLADGVVTQDVLEQASQRAIEIREMLQAKPSATRPREQKRGLQGFASSRGTRRLPQEQLKQVMTTAGGSTSGSNVMPGNAPSRSLEKDRDPKHMMQLLEQRFIEKAQMAILAELKISSKVKEMVEELRSRPDFTPTPTMEEPEEYREPVTTLSPIPFLYLSTSVFVCGFFFG